jgi:hypothetical protein
MIDYKDFQTVVDMNAFFRESGYIIISVETTMAIGLLRNYRVWFRT